MSSMKPNEWWLLIILSVFWGGSFFFVEVALRDFQPFTLVFLRIAIAALILAGVVYLTAKRLPASLKTWGGYVVMGMLNNAIPFSLIVWGQTRIESGVASILNGHHTDFHGDSRPLFNLRRASDNSKNRGCFDRF